MANALLTPTQWWDSLGAAPPQWWNGTLYACADAGIGASSVMNNVDPATFQRIANPGDILAFTLDNLAAPPGMTPATFMLTIGGATVLTVDLTVVGSTTFTSEPFAGGEEIDFQVSNAGFSLYNFDFTITPTSDGPPPTGCFWTDFVGCAEDCSDVPPPVTGTFNLHTWNMHYNIGCCSGADDSCVQTDEEPDAFGDIPYTPEPTLAPDGTTVSPAMGTVQLLVPVVCLSRGTPPACTDQLPTPRLRATVKLTPPSGGTPDWDFLGAFGTVPSLSMQAYIYDTAGAENEPVLTGDQFGDIQIDTSGSPWVMTVLCDVDLSSNSMPDTETASVGVRFTYTGSDSSGTPVAVVSVELDVEATCPC